MTPPIPGAAASSEDTAEPIRQAPSPGATVARAVPGEPALRAGSSASTDASAGGVSAGSESRPTTLDGALAAGAAALDPASAASAAEEATPIRGEPEAVIDRRSARFWTIAGGHVAVDLYAAVIPALSLALAATLSLDKVQLRSIFVLNSVISGVSQPIFARLTDKLDTRFCAPAGLAIAAICLCLIGYAHNYGQLVALQVVGMIGVGMFHPIGAALSGHLGRGLRLGRSMAVTIFFTAGMVGSVLGPVIVTRMNEAGGLSTLVWLIAPGLLFAVVLHAASARVPHRHSLVTEVREEPPALRATRRRAVQLLFWAAVMRFGVNTGLFYLFAMWAKERIPTDANEAASLNGVLFAAGSMGMGVAATLAGWKVRAGREKNPMVWLPVLGVPLIVLMAFTPAQAPWGYAVMLALVATSAAGYAASAPLAISLAQRLMPGNTGVASSLMMGGAWTLSAFFPFLAGWAVDAGEALGVGGLRLAFCVMAVFLALNAWLASRLPRALLRDTAHN